MIDRDHRLPIKHQAELLDLSRSSVYCRPRPVRADTLALMRRIDELHLGLPFSGSRMLWAWRVHERAGTGSAV